MTANTFEENFNLATYHVILGEKTPARELNAINLQSRIGTKKNYNPEEIKNHIKVLLSTIVRYNSDYIAKDISEMNKSLPIVPICFYVLNPNIDSITIRLSPFLEDAKSYEFRLVTLPREESVLSFLKLV